jgi:hypothetical protein
MSRRNFVSWLVCFLLVTLLSLRSVFAIGAIFDIGAIANDNITKQETTSSTITKTTLHDCIHKFIMDHTDKTLSALIPER